MPLITADRIHADQASPPDMCDVLNDQDIVLTQSQWQTATHVRLHMPQFADGRAFSQAQRLRSLGFRGIIRLAGHVIPDQLPHALRCGIDEIEISQDLLHRTTAAAWLRQTAWPSYQQRLQSGQMQ